MLFLAGLTNLPPAEKMNLRFPAQFQQLLILGGLFFLTARVARAQQDAEAVIAGKTTRIKVVSIVGNSLMIKTEFGDQGVPLSTISEIRMTPPGEFSSGMQAYQEKDYPKALALIRSVTDRFRGLPVDWAKTASVVLVEISLAMNDIQKADLEFSALLRAYPTGNSLQGDLLTARIALAKKNFALAKQKVSPIADAALKDKAPNFTTAPIYGQAFLISGQVKESDGQFASALEDYLRTVTIFYQDRTVALQAQERADALRLQHPEISIP